MRPQSIDELIVPHNSDACRQAPAAAALFGQCVVLLAMGLGGCAPGSSGAILPRQAWMNGRFPIAVKGSPQNAAEVTELEKMGVNVVFGNVNPEVRRALKDNGILYFMNVSVFHDSNARDREDLLAVDNHGSQKLEGWQTFVCPVRKDYRSRKIAEIEDGVRRLKPDGVSLDFIRYPVFWEMMGPDDLVSEIRNFCFCEHCLKYFQKRTGIVIPMNLATTNRKASWILAEHGQRWTDWKCSVITSMVKRIRAAARMIQPDILIDIHALPWRLGDYGGAVKSVAGQDFVTLASCVDIFSPMCYHTLLGRKPQWAPSVVEETARLTGKPVWPCVQVKGLKDNEAYSNAPVSPCDFHQVLEYALRPPACGINVLDWPGLKENRQKIDIYRRIAESKRPN